MDMINEIGNATAGSSTPILVTPCAVRQFDWNFGTEPYRLSVTSNSTQSDTEDLISSYTMQEYNWTVVQPLGSSNQITLYDSTGLIGTSDVYQVVSGGRDPIGKLCLSPSSDGSSSVTPSSTSTTSSAIPTSSSTSISTIGNTRPSSSSSTAAIAGGAAGGGIVVTVILAVLTSLWRRRRRARNRAMEIIDPGDEGLPTYTEVVMPHPTTLTRTTSQSDLSSALVHLPVASGKRTFSKEVKRSAIHPDLPPEEAFCRSVTPSSPPPTMRIHNPDPGEP
ncbi:unnamed protein product [Peniophora sp. CBMAI 1063]|nr:unnamed protein product [Peniophora sp. CBMAI 1063]